MSQLLDALKKSEQRRQQVKPRNNGNGAASPVVGAPSRKTTAAEHKRAFPWVRLAGLLVAAVIALASIRYWQGLQDRVEFVALPAPEKGVAVTSAQNDRPTSPVLSESTSKDADLEEQVQVPALKSLPEAVLNELPNIAFTFHQFSDVGNARYVVMNGKRLEEGSLVEPGLILEGITVDGVILDYSGIRFSMSALQHWVRD